MWRAQDTELRQAMSESFEHEAPCELCGKKIATTFAYFDDHQPGRHWLFSCQCSDERQDYSIAIGDFFSNPAATMDGLAQLNKKPWMNWREFVAMLERFRTVNEVQSRP